MKLINVDSKGTDVDMAVYGATCGIGFDSIKLYRADLNLLLQLPDDLLRNKLNDLFNRFNANHD